MTATPNPQPALDAAIAPGLHIGRHGLGANEAGLYAVHA